ncbi:MAG: Cell-division protein [Candidatus Falkowbacteria bacterium GW2011_GWC2_38_22]|uniref:Cell division protein FtsX n=1 Tax=Candidatus Falkowbacteria bacterium GW2011_GWE1_38_31 TaxID=1618638 RepID=A0A0G0K663_9BACT|nr:MAG: Cell-division protein [Candidatus Falkowbacteria bacterium GW2011_GWF2_38_1205]KKQ62115.1 MAG: Cell-division protein [Candidatus Falkowbacteria bacterium GW2011_GWC2_38_22]KKQ64265.1 MAG: Cell-division protein [Candidatus Falkowbacteria bacterium GW2011_GWF1_38_22]KKQ66242.1 MAG: Cell-division protein [Candidatus Falkowbacteria bacterium GW2011_GWE2_38_254]KKQ70970.1 MAG: Cell-division protein [Candidatus Falkowbacteria bacterium GW2011_GWE1_38_31]KKQ73479.1 MAG: Cell-division protein 
MTKFLIKNMFLSFARIIKFSFQDIFRNIWLSLVTIIILILALFTVNMLLVVSVVGETAVGAVHDKIDINLYLKTDAKEEEILALKAKISELSEVKEVTYVSKEAALKNFTEKHKENQEILGALRELNINPLTPTMVIKPVNLDVFDNLINKLNAYDSEIIESRNFTNYKTLLGKINNITKKVTDAGLMLSSIFVFITMLVIYNSVRVAIYTHRRQISIMKLVGASNYFIQMPYLVSSIIYTLFGVLAIMVIFYPFLSLLQPYLETFFVGYNINLITYFYGNAFNIFGLQFLAAALINIVASLIAVRKYSRV